MGVEPKIGWLKPPQIIHLEIGFSIIFTIHFGGKHPIFWFNIQICIPRDRITLSDDEQGVSNRLRNA